MTECETYDQPNAVFLLVKVMLCLFIKHSMPISCVYSDRHGRNHDSTSVG